MSQQKNHGKQKNHGLFKDYHIQKLPSTFSRTTPAIFYHVTWFWYHTKIMFTMQSQSLKKKLKFQELQDPLPSNSKMSGPYLYLVFKKISRSWKKFRENFQRPLAILFLTPDKDFTIHTVLIIVQTSAVTIMVQHRNFR